MGLILSFFLVKYIFFTDEGYTLPLSSMENVMKSKSFRAHREALRAHDHSIQIRPPGGGTKTLKKKE